MDKKKAGTDWAKGGIITLAKPIDTENKVNKEKIVNTVDAVYTDNTNNIDNTNGTDNMVNIDNTDNTNNTEKKHPKREKMHRLTIDMTEEDFKKLRIIAAYHGKNVSAYLRDIVINGNDSV